MDDTTRRRGWLRRHPFLVGIGLVTVAIVAAVAIVGPRRVAERALVLLFEQAGLGPASVTVSHAGPDGLELSDLSLAGGDAVSLHRLRIALTWSGAGPRLALVDISGLKAKLVWSGGTLRLGTRTIPTTSAQPSAAPVSAAGLLAALPGAFRLTDAHLTVEGAGARLIAASEGALTLAKTGGAGAFALRVEPLASPATLAPHVGRLDLRADSRGDVEARLALTPEAGATGARSDMTGWAALSGDGRKMGTQFDLHDLEAPVGLRAERLSAAFVKTPDLPDGLIALEAVGAATETPLPLAIGGVQTVLRIVPKSAATHVVLEACAELHGVEGTLVVVKSVRLCPDKADRPLVAVAKKGGQMTLAATVLSAQMAVHEKAGSDFVRGQSPTFNLDATLEGQDWKGSLTAEGGDFSLQGRVIRLTDLALTGHLAGQGSTVISGDLTLSNAYIKDWTPSPLFAPLTFTGTGQIADNRIELNAAARREGAIDVATAVLHHDLSTRAGRVDLTLTPLTFVPRGLQPGALVPFLTRSVTAASGAVSGRGWFAWSADAVTSGADAHLRDLSFTTGLGRIEGVDGDVHLASLSPPRTSSLQTLRVKTMDLGVPLPDGKLSFSISPDRTLHVREATWSFLDGTIGLASGQFGTGNTQTATFAVSHVNLEKLFGLIDVRGLTGTGFVSGRVPVTFTPGAQVIAGGMLAADGPGTLVYKSGDGAGGTEGSAGILYKALDNFHYKELSAKLDGDLSGELSVGVHLRGSNPDLYNGYPVELNVATSGPFVSMIRKSFYRYQPSSDQ